MEFFTQLRGNLSQPDQRQVDAILDNLFHLPGEAEQSHLDQCIYRRQAAGQKIGECHCVCSCGYTTYNQFYHNQFFLATNCCNKFTRQLIIPLLSFISGSHAHIPGEYLNPSTQSHDVHRLHGSLPHDATPEQQPPSQAGNKYPSPPEPQVGYFREGQDDSGRVPPYGAGGQTMPGECKCSQGDAFQQFIIIFTYPFLNKSYHYKVKDKYHYLLVD